MPKNNQPGPELARPRTPDTNAAPSVSFGLAPLASLRKHPLIAVLVLLSALGVGAPLALKFGIPDYYANTVIYVSPTFIRTLREDHEQERQYTTLRRAG